MRRLIPALLLLATPVTARAQFGLERVLNYISVANINTQVSCLVNSNAMTAPGGGTCGLRGFGVEVGLDLNPDTAKAIRS